MDRITAKFGEVYVIPSSVDETLIVPKRFVDDVESLGKMVREINANDVRPEDQLSNNIYEYDSKTQSLKIVGGGQTQSEDNSTDDEPEENNNENQNSEEDQSGQKMAM